MAAGRIIPGKLYTRETFKALIEQTDVRQLQFEGYVMRHELVGGQIWYGIVPWQEASSGEWFGTMAPPKGGTGTFEPLEPIKRRTPQERLDSLMQKVGPDLHRLREQESAEEVLAEARAALEEAERKNEKGQPAPSD